MKRGFLQISFAWLFGIIAGAIILGLAIFFVVRITNTSQYQTSSEAQKEISVLLNPLETGFESGTVTTLSLSTPTRIYNTCDNKSGLFGKQIISISQQTFNKWSVSSAGNAMQNKYIFSDNVSEGKNFYLFSKPFEFPFKVADLIYLTPSSNNYCFINPPSSVHDELINLNQQNLFVQGNDVTCPQNSINVCFTGQGTCNGAEVVVDYPQGTVEKNNEQMSFSSDALMYAAVFSDKSIYNCQLKRLMKREVQLSGLYKEKSSLIQGEGCSSRIISDLSSLESSADTFGNPETDLGNIGVISDNLQNKNEVLKCPLW